MVRNVFQGHLDVSEHVFDNIFMFRIFLTLYDAKNERGSSKWLIFADFCLDPHFA